MANLGNFTLPAGYKFWKNKEGKFIKNEAGSLIYCDRCPCELTCDSIPKIIILEEWLALSWETGGPCEWIEMLCRYSGELESCTRTSTVVTGEYKLLPTGGDQCYIEWTTYVYLNFGSDGSLGGYTPDMYASSVLHYDEPPPHDNCDSPTIYARVQFPE